MLEMCLPSITTITTLKSIDRTLRGSSQSGDLRKFPEFFARQMQNICIENEMWRATIKKELVVRQKCLLPTLSGASQVYH